MDSRWRASSVQDGGIGVDAPASAHHNGSPSLKDSRPHEGESSPGLTSLHPPLIHPQVQCGIFSTIFNPTGERLGNKILRQRLRGPALAAYYPRRVATFKDLQRLYPGFETYNEHEEDRLEHLQIAKSRGKGAPKKKRTAAGEIGNVAQLAKVVAEGTVILTDLTQRARSSTARRGNSGFTRWIEIGFRWEEFWDTGNCTISPHEYPSWERRLLVFACISYGFPNAHLRHRSMAAPQSSRIWFSYLINLCTTRTSKRFRDTQRIRLRGCSKVTILHSQIDILCHRSIKQDFSHNRRYALNRDTLRTPRTEHTHASRKTASPAPSPC
jgi:small subunit ribosomal protein S33